MQFNSTILILPGLGNSGEGHWQTIWENTFGFIRVQQANWEAPVCNEWIDTIDKEVLKYDLSNVIDVLILSKCCSFAHAGGSMQR